MIITPRQIRAARDLLMMSQEQLAMVAGVSPRTILKAEAEPKPNQVEYVSYESLAKIRKSLEGRRIEFVGTRGVIHHEESQAKAFEGPDSPNIFYTDILAAAQENRDEVFAVYDTTETLARSFGVVNFNDLSRLEEISKRATVKCLLTNSEKSFLSLPFFQVRATPRFPFGYQSRVICGKLHATIQTVDGKHFSYYEMPSLDLALAGKMDFSSAWISSQPLAEMEPLKKKARA